MKWDARLCRDRLQRGVVADDGGDFDGQFAGLMAPDQVVQAMRQRTHQDRCAHRPAVEADAPAHRVTLGQRGPGRGEVVGVEVAAAEVELHAHEEFAMLAVGVLIRVQQVAAVLGDEVRHGRNDAARVRAGDQQAGGGGDGGGYAPPN